MASSAPITKTDITDALKTIRNRRTEGRRYDAERVFIELIERKDCCKNTDYTPCQLHFICNEYMKCILKRYLSDPQKIEIVMVAFGMLEGYTLQMTLGDRRNHYIEQGFCFNENVKRAWFDNKKKSRADNPRSTEDDFFDIIAESLLKDAHLGALGLFEEVIQSLQKEYPSGIPEKVPLDIPQYTKDSPAQRKTTTETDVPATSQRKWQSNAKWYRILPASLSLICLIASVCLFVASHNNENIIQEISVAESEISLYPGGYERLQIWTYPEDADLDELECHSDSNPWITVAKTNDWADVNPWTDAWNVTAENNWTEELPYAGKVSVMGGKAIPVYVDVTVKAQAYRNDTGILNGTANEFDDAGEENSDALVNP